MIKKNKKKLFIFIFISLLLVLSILLYFKFHLAKSDEKRERSNTEEIYNTRVEVLPEILLQMKENKNIFDQNNNEEKFKIKRFCDTIKEITNQIYSLNTKKQNLENDKKNLVDREINLLKEIYNKKGTQTDSYKNELIRLKINLKKIESEIKPILIEIENLEKAKKEKQNSIEKIYKERDKKLKKLVSSIDKFCRNIKTRLFYIYLDKMFKYKEEFNFFLNKLEENLEKNLSSREYDLKGLICDTKLVLIQMEKFLNKFKKIGLDAKYDNEKSDFYKITNLIESKSIEYLPDYATYFISKVFPNNKPIHLPSWNNLKDRYFTSEELNLNNFLDESYHYYFERSGSDSQITKVNLEEDGKWHYYQIEKFKNQFPKLSESERKIFESENSLNIDTPNKQSELLNEEKSNLEDFILFQGQKILEDEQKFLSEIREVLPSLNGEYEADRDLSSLRLENQLNDCLNCDNLKKKTFKFVFPLGLGISLQKINFLDEKEFNRETFQEDICNLKEFLNQIILGFCELKMFKNY
ncbi:MAG: hypothetical protein Q8781_01580 [Candidatus Phytoplasma stylosanthis]|uniref:hypothetical protein n=1 Tax=Candidatus Phytoplasma stylosanthis TaxID=2798314 RepID=UPI002939A9D0|nr:hypothetical protein [Candidatus Phytoplasma stylosanthis]MDV3167746.1 hypothetical protein [Candidatus Phytoplasma stylosanthis]MDV3170978.1 hypothetical protein [Candidatus Phytoplasma stylosanthis]MDV3174151.1 hypothetical protein [Candidatus Phytoplasma stylosanthis]MDV3202331.1 hypothetical protein [Candidatus Phytoplasma stylosanthis]